MKRIVALALLSLFLIVEVASTHVYEVTILTADVSYGGTGSGLYYTFIGEKGNTPEHDATHDKWAGKVDLIQIADPTDIGKFKCLKIRMDGSDGWYPQEIDVKIDGVSQGTILNKQGWLDDDATKTYCLEPLYEVTIQTSDIWYAGSDSAFYYTFVGTKGQTSEYKADNFGNDRTGGQTNTWKFSDATDIGDFTCLHIRMDGSDGWYFDNVDIKVNGVALPTIPNKHGWLDDDADVDFCRSPVKYEVTITTSGVKYASSDSSFYYTIVGSEGQTGEYEADNVGNDRNRGATETWSFSDINYIGKFKCLHIRMVGKDGWLFGAVDIKIDGVAIPTISNTFGWLDDDAKVDFCAP